MTPLTTGMGFPKLQGQSITILICEPVSLVMLETFTHLISSKINRKSTDIKQK